MASPGTVLQTLAVAEGPFATFPETNNAALPLPHLVQLHMLRLTSRVWATTDTCPVELSAPDLRPANTDEGLVDLAEPDSRSAHSTASRIERTVCSMLTTAPRFEPRGRHRAVADDRQPLFFFFFFLPHLVDVFVGRRLCRTERHLHKSRCHAQSGPPFARITEEVDTLLMPAWASPPIAPASAFGIGIVGAAEVGRGDRYLAPERNLRRAGSCPRSAPANADRGGRTAWCQQ